MSRSLAANAIKVPGALLLAGVLLYLFVIPAVDVLTRPHPVATGPHALIIASTERATVPHALHTFLTGRFEERVTIQFLVAAVNKDEANGEHIGLHVTFFGPEGRAEDVQCQDEDVPLVGWGELGEGARAAFGMDAWSTRAGAHPRGARAEPSDSTSFPAWRGDITVADDNSSSSWGSGVLRCSLPASWVWASVPQQVTALLPQINFNAISNTHDFQQGLYGDVSLTRSSDWTLSEAYPDATMTGYDITQKLNSYWQGNRGEQGTLGYLAQPELMFTKRYTSDEDAKTLTIGGVAVGVAGSLIVSSMARIVDSFVEVTGRLRVRFRRTREPDETYEPDWR